MQPMRLLVTDTAAQSPRQSTAWLIMTLGIRPIFREDYRPADEAPRTL